VAEATRYLRAVTVPRFAERLIRLPLRKRLIFPLVQYLHSAGINVRLLGLVFMSVVKMQRTLATPSGEELLQEQADDAGWYFRTVMLIEMAARVIKDAMRLLLRTKMRELCQPGEVCLGSPSDALAPRHGDVQLKNTAGRVPQGSREATESSVWHERRIRGACTCMSSLVPLIRRPSVLSCALTCSLQWRDVVGPAVEKKFVPFSLEATYERVRSIFHALVLLMQLQRCHKPQAYDPRSWTEVRCVLDVGAFL
jgi:hypothetical protein